MRCRVRARPNLPETRHMLNARTLALLPDHSVLINTSRGPLIDESALVAEVHRRPLYLYLDVTDPEPPAADSPLRNAPNIRTLPIAPLIAEAIGRTAAEESVSSLFD